MLCLDTLGLSSELATHAVRALAFHNAAWWKRERAARRELLDWQQRVQYLAPPVTDRPLLRDAPRLLTLGHGGCAELAAMYLGWVWSRGERAELDTTRVNLEVWHFRVVRLHGGPGRVLWDPERVLAHVA